jgi:hypothetical protein
MFDVEERCWRRLHNASGAGDAIVHQTKKWGIAFAVATIGLAAPACSGDVDNVALHPQDQLGLSPSTTTADATPGSKAHLFPNDPAMPAADPAPPTNTGNTPPGPAFLMRLSEGFDEATQYQSAYAMEVPWNGSGFAPDNIHYGPNGATLVIQKRRMRSLSYTGAELQRKGFYGYGRYEAIVKAPVGSGLVSSFFTHTSSQFGDPHDEIDIEFLGRDTHHLHINYFKDGRAAGSFYAPVDFDTSRGFHLYAFEWAPDSIRWYADGKLVHEVHGPAARVPRATGRVMMNIWSAGPASRGWLGLRRFKNNASVVYRCVSHVPLGQTAPQCSDTYHLPSAAADASSAAPAVDR